MCVFLFLDLQNKFVIHHNTLWVLPGRHAYMRAYLRESMSSMLTREHLYVIPCLACFHSYMLACLHESMPSVLFSSCKILTNQNRYKSHMINKTTKAPHFDTTYKKYPKHHKTPQSDVSLTFFRSKFWKFRSFFTFCQF